jgi:hypothetical protein
MPSRLHCRLTASSAFGVIIACLSAVGRWGPGQKIAFDLQLADLAVQIVDYLLRIVARRRCCHAEPTRALASSAPASAPRARSGRTLLAEGLSPGGQMPLGRLTAAAMRE